MRPLLPDALDHPVGGRQRMPAAGRLVPVHQVLVGGLEEQDAVVDPELLQLVERLRELAEEDAAARIDHDRDLRQAPRARDQLGHRREQRWRQVVDDEVPEVLQRVRGLGPSGADRPVIARNRGPQAVPPRGVGLLSTGTTSAVMPPPRSESERGPVAERSGDRLDGVQPFEDRRRRLGPDARRLGDLLRLRPAGRTSERIAS